MVASSLRCSTMSSASCSRSSAEPAFTGELSIRYEAGVPIGVPLECRVRLADRDGRKLYLTGELTAGGDVVARSNATFITIDREQFMTGAH